MFTLVFFGVITISIKLSKDSQWSIARALSDNSVVSKQDPEDSKNTIIEQIDLPSSSRLIAFLGMVVLLATFLGIGSVMIWTLGRTGQVSGMGDAQGFLWAGLSMFAPYLFNQSKEAIKSLGCNPTQTPPPSPIAAQPVPAPSAVNPVLVANPGAKAGAAPATDGKRAGG